MGIDREDVRIRVSSHAVVAEECSSGIILTQARIDKLGASMDTTKRYLRSVADEPRDSWPCDVCGEPRVADALNVCQDCRRVGLEAMEEHVEKHADQYLTEAL